MWRALWLCLLNPQQRSPVGPIMCARMHGDWRVDWKEADMSLEDRLSVPDGPLRKNRRRYRNLCPRKTTGCQLHASSPVEKRQSRSKKKPKKSFFLAVWLPQYLHFTFTNWQDIPRSAYIHIQLPKCLHVSCFRWTWRENKWVSRFYFHFFSPKHHSFNHLSSFFLEKVYLLPKRKCGLCY